MRPVVDDDVAYFRSIGVVTELADERRRRDWMDLYGTDEVSWVARPSTTLHVSRVLAYCFEQGICVTPQAGNTGLVGGSVPLSHELILSLDRMNSVSSFDPLSGVVVCEAGCTLAALDDHVKAHGHTVPLDLGPRDQCQIGGNIATNAGGLRFCRWGSLHGSVVGLEVVLADKEGTVLDLGMAGLQKDNTGYDLKHLLIGSEGTLGVVTRCALKCPILFKSVQLAWIRCATFRDVLDALVRAKRVLGEILSAFECLDEESLRFARTVVDVDESRLWKASEVAGECFIVIIETRGSSAIHDREKLGDLLAQVGQPAGLCGSEDLQRDVWKLRTSVSAGLKKSGVTFKYDISLPVGTMDDMLDATRRRLQPLRDLQRLLVDHGAGEYARICWFGHMLDGNVHLNVSCQPAHEAEVRRLLEPWVYEEVTRRHGSISAEHGIGCMKAAALAMTKDRPVMDLMRQVKALLDPKGIMNPGKLFASLPTVGHRMVNTPPEK